LQFEVNIGRTKDAAQAVQKGTGLVRASPSKGQGEWPLIAAGKANEPGRMFLQFPFSHSALSLACAQLHVGKQAT
jgi:hypothetical protein